MRLIIWQRLVPSVDGKRVALREFLVFKEEIRDLLLDSASEQITAAVRCLVAEHGQGHADRCGSKFKAILISERLYKILSASHAFSRHAHEGQNPEEKVAADTSSPACARMTINENFSRPL